MYIRGALGCVIVTDILKPETMEHGALDWKSLVDTQADPLIDGKTIPIVLFNNKVDLVDNKSLLGENEQYLKQFVKKNGFDGGFLTSAKENVNLTDAFSYLTQLIIRRHLSKTDISNDFEGNRTHALKKNSSEKKENSGCC